MAHPPTIPQQDFEEFINNALVVEDNGLPSIEYCLSLVDQLNIPNCEACQEAYLFCPCTRSLHASLVPSAVNHEAVPQQSTEMESTSGTLAPASHAPTLPDNTHTDLGTSGLTSPPPNTLDNMAVAALDAGPRADWLDTPASTRYLNHIQSSNVRGSGEETGWSADHSAAIGAQNIAPDDTYDNLNYEYQPPVGMDSKDGVPVYEQDRASNFYLARPEGSLAKQYLDDAMMDPDTDNPNAQAYAKLIFPDGDFLVKTHDVLLGRNTNAHKEWKNQMKQERNALKAVETYRKEPSQPSQSQYDDEQRIQPSNSSQSRDGRRVPPSNYSELGGIAWHPAQPDGNDAEGQQAHQKRRKSAQFSKSSSTGSIAPANLHVGLMPGNSTQVVFNEAGEPEERSSVFLPIHTPDKNDLTKISKEHLQISYNFQQEVWQLHVLGNGAFVNDIRLGRNDVIDLQHNDRILIVNLDIMFKLPDNHRRSPGLSRGTFSMYSENDVESDDNESPRAPSTSPARRLSNALEAGDSDEDQIENATDRKAVAKSNKKKTKVKNEKSQPTLKGKKPKKDSPVEASPEATKKMKGKEPKEPTASSPTEPPVVKPGSMLANIPIGDLPEKRKGPGRPPKEGNVSKRDLGLANKKKKEIEKRGEEPPAFAVLVDMVRRETKMKEAKAKALANGLPAPDTDVLDSIENDATNNAAATSSKAGGVGNASLTPGDEARAKKSPPKPKRTVKTPSPMPPASSFTEEQLVRPPLNYVQMIDTVLQEYPGGKADLQTIYDLICKRWPHFKYRQGGLGWQSSVRHNLAQNDRFKGDEKLAKGKLWEIDFTVPLEKEKKTARRPSPQSQVQQNGQPVAGPSSQFGNMTYGNPYSQHPQNGPVGPQGGSNTYNSPYAQPGQQPGIYYGHPPHMGGPNGAYQAHNRQPQVPNHIPPPQRPYRTPGAPPIFDDLIDTILDYRAHYLKPLVGNQPAHDHHVAMFQEIVDPFSNLFPHQAFDRLSELRNGLDSDVKRNLFDGMMAVFSRFPYDIYPNVGNGDDEDGEAAGGVQQAVEGSDANQMDAGAAAADAQPTPIPSAEPANAPPPQSASTPSAPPTTEATPGLGPGSGTKRAAEDDGEGEGPETKRARNDEDGGQ